MSSDTHQLHYTGMDITCLYTSSWEFICDGIRVGGCPVHVGRNNYVPLFGVDTDLRYYHNIIFVTMFLYIICNHMLVTGYVLLAFGEIACNK